MFSFTEDAPCWLLGRKSAEAGSSVINRSFLFAWGRVMALWCSSSFPETSFSCVRTGGSNPTGVLNLRCCCVPGREFCNTTNVFLAVRLNQISHQMPSPASCDLVPHWRHVQQRLASLSSGRSLPTEVSQQFQDLSCNRHCRQARSLWSPLAVLLLPWCWPGTAGGERQWKDRLQTVWIWSTPLWKQCVLRGTNLM